MKESTDEDSMNVWTEPGIEGNENYDEFKQRLENDTVYANGEVEYMGANLSNCTPVVRLGQESESIEYFEEITRGVMQQASDSHEFYRDSKKATQVFVKGLYDFAVEKAQEHGEFVVEDTDFDQLMNDTGFPKVSNPAEFIDAFGDYSDRDYVRSMPAASIVFSRAQNEIRNYLEENNLPEW